MRLQLGDWGGAERGQGTKRIAVRALTSGCFFNTASSQSVVLGSALPSGLALFTGGCRPSRVPCMEAKQAVADKNRQDRSSSRPRYLTHQFR